MYHKTLSFYRWRQKSNSFLLTARFCRSWCLCNLVMPKARPGAVGPLGWPWPALGTVRYNGSHTITLWQNPYWSHPPSPSGSRQPKQANEDQWGPTAASIDVQGWTQVCFFCFIHSFSIDIWYSNIIFIGPIQANGSQWQLTTANTGQQQSMQANKYQWKPTVASTGQMMWHIIWTQGCFYFFLFIHLLMIFYILGVMVHLQMDRRN